MGLYDTTILYHGRLLSTAAFKRLDGLATKGYISKVCKDRWILHAPHKHIVVGSMDPVIENHEKRARRIQQAEVDRMLSRSPKHKLQWESTTADEIHRLNELVKVAADDQEAVPGTYMCEIAWALLDPASSYESISYNLKVV